MGGALFRHGSKFVCNAQDSWWGVGVTVGIVPIVSHNHVSCVGSAAGVEVLLASLCLFVFLGLAV